MQTHPADTELLHARIRAQEQALADLAIERRSDQLTITMLRLRCLDLEANLERSREAVARRHEEVEELEQQLRRARLASAGAQRALARLQQERSGEPPEAVKARRP